MQYRVIDHCIICGDEARLSWNENGTKKSYCVKCAAKLPQGKMVIQGIQRAMSQKEQKVANATEPCVTG